MVAGGNVNAVVVLFRDRIARGVYAQLLAEEFHYNGARKKIAERMNRSKRRRAREGKLVACPQADYGFRYNDARDGYEVDQPRMALVQRIFRMVGVEGMTMNAVARGIEAEGIPSPGGKRF